MKIALLFAKKSYSMLEVPVGAVIVKDNKIISVGYNNRETTKNVFGHAEINAINNACIYFSSWRLNECDLYSTLEPCPMCAGAIINSRISNLIFGAYDTKNGAAGSITNIFKKNFTHKTNVFDNFMQKECSKILSDFFNKIRKK